MRALTFLLLGFLLVVAPVRADDVKTKSGRTYKDLTLVRETKTQYVFETEAGRKLRLAKDAVASIEKKPTKRGELYRRMEEAGKKDVTKNLQLAEWAAANGFEREANRTYKSVLKLDKSNATANRALGNVLVDGEWKSAKEAQREKEKALEGYYKKLGWKKTRGEWQSPVEAYRAKKKMVQKDGVWVEGSLLSAIERDNKEWFEGEWYTPAEMKRIKGDERRFKGAWRAIRDINEIAKADRSVDNWVVKGKWVEVHSNSSYKRVQEALVVAEDCYEHLMKLFGMEHPDLYGRRGRLVLFIGNGPNTYHSFTQDETVTDREGYKASCNGSFYLKSFDGGRGAGITYAYGDRDYVDMWIRNVLTIAFLDRFMSWERLDSALVEAFAGYATALDAKGFSPKGALFDRYLSGRDTRHPIEAGSKILTAVIPDGYQGLPSGRRGISYERRPPQAGLFLEFLRQKDPTAFQEAVRLFLVDEMNASRMTKRILETDVGHDVDEMFAKFYAEWLQSRK